MLLNAFDEPFGKIFAVHGKDRLPATEEDLEVAALLHPEGDALFGKPTFELRALQLAAFRLIDIVHTFVYRRKALSDRNARLDRVVIRAHALGCRIEQAGLGQGLNVRVNVAVVTAEGFCEGADTGDVISADVA